MPDDPLPLRHHAAAPAPAEPEPAAAPVASLRDAPRARLDAEAERLVRLERQLADLQLILKSDQARLAIDRLRFAVHGLCGTALREDGVLPDDGRWLVRVK